MDWVSRNRQPVWGVSGGTVGRPPASPDYQPLRLEKRAQVAQTGKTMELDPSKWLVSFAGFVYDVLITREWTKILIGMSPLALLVGLMVAVWGGGQLNKGRLATWYLELGDKEVAAWEQSWAPTKAAKTTDGGTGPSEPEAATGDSAEQPNNMPTLPRTQVSRFAEVLFRRVQLLEPSNRSLFMIGATLAQRGAADRAIKLLTKIAPNDEAGYAPAHAYLAMLYQTAFLANYQAGQPTAQLLPVAELAMHHAQQAATWDRVPTAVLQYASAMYADIEKDSNTSLRLLELGAQRDPKLLPSVIARAKLSGNERYAASATKDAIEYAEKQLEQDPKDVEARLMLSETYVWNKDLELAEATLRAVDCSKDERLTRALSDIYCMKFEAELELIRTGKQSSANLSLLETSMQIDPTNPRIPQQIAGMAFSGAARPNNEMIEMLQRFLAEGKATTTTHLLISRVYLMRNNFEKAMPHMEQVAVLEPRHHDNLNNLAYVYAVTKPDKLEEAMQLVQNAILQTKNQPNAGYIDTLGVILMKLGRINEAIAAFQKAINVDPNRIDVQQNIRDAYLANGQPDMAEVHAKRIEFLEEQKKIAEKKGAATSADSNAQGNPNSQSEASTPDNTIAGEAKGETGEQGDQAIDTTTAGSESGAEWIDDADEANAPPSPETSSERVTNSPN